MTTSSDLRFNGAFSLAQAAMHLFEFNGHSRNDVVSIANYGECVFLVPC